MANDLQLVVSTLQTIVQGVNAIATTVNGALVKIWAAFAGVALTDAVTVAVDMSTGFNFTLLATAGIGATRALGNPTNAKPGQRGVIVFTQSSGGSNALTYGSAYVAAGGTGSLTTSAGANNIDVFSYTVLPSGKVLLVLSATVSH